MQQETTNGTEVYSSAMGAYEFALKCNKRPQMIYNYIKSNMIKSYHSKEGKVMISAEECTKWSQKWSKATK